MRSEEEKRILGGTPFKKRCLSIEVVEIKSELEKQNNNF